MIGGETQFPRPPPPIDKAIIMGCKQPYIDFSHPAFVLGLRKKEKEKRLKEWQEYQRNPFKHHHKFSTIKKHQQMPLSRNNISPQQNQRKQGQYTNHPINKTMTKTKIITAKTEMTMKKTKKITTTSVTPSVPKPTIPAPLVIGPPPSLESHIQNNYSPYSSPREKKQDSPVQ